MPSAEQTLERLGLSFTVKDIMVPRERLVCASAEADAPGISEENPDYSVIPILDRGVLTAFYERNTKSSQLISVQDVLGDATGIGDLLEVLNNRRFCFVMARNEIGGYVHFSDLNNPLVKLALYVIFEAFERHLLRAITPVTDEELEQGLSPKRVTEIRKELQKAQTNDANLSLESLLYLPEILRIAVNKRKLRLDAHQLRGIKTFRNRVSHAGWLLVNDDQEVKALVEAKRNCIKVLKGDGAPFAT